MRELLRMAWRNLSRSPGRTLALVGIATAAFLCVTLVKAGYAFMFERARESQAASSGDLWLVATDSEGRAGRGLRLADYSRLRSRLLAEGRVSAIRASCGISGIVGGEESSAPFSGIAYEGRFEPAPRADAAAEGAPVYDGAVEADMGAELARSLGLREGDEFSALVEDLGLSLRLRSVVSTEARTRDRFYLAIPLEALVARAALRGYEGLEASTISFWAKPDSREAPNGIAELEKELARMPELAGYKAYAYGLGNTPVNSIVGVYSDNYRIVLVVVAGALLLALSNATLLTVQERGEEWGTMLALGAPRRSLGALLVLEAIASALIACALGSFLTIAAKLATDAIGGLRFPPPPTRSEPLVIMLQPEFPSFLLAAALTLGCALCAAIASSLGLRRRSVVQLLAERE